MINILWADDEIDLLKPHILYLEGKGYSLTPAISGNDALDYLKEKSFDLIVSNPPYIGKKDPHLTNLTFEPSHALIATQNGLGDIKKIIKHSTKILKKRGILLLEHGFDQSNEIKKTLVEYGFSSIHTIKDYQDHQRVTFGTL